MASEVQICNLALSHVGGYRIQSLSESTKEARECNLLYPYARDAALADHDWGFARKRLTLALLSVTYTGWDYAYQYPIDCLRFRKILDVTGAYTGTTYVSEDESYKQVGKVKFEIASNSDLNSKVILTDKKDAEGVYTAKVTDTNMFDLLFVDALSWRLAADLSQPLKGKPQLQQALMKQYLALIGQAKAKDANESEEKPNNVNEILRARL